AAESAKKARRSKSEPRGDHRETNQKNVLGKVSQDRRFVGVVMKPALVTGASGFLGWHVARLLVERGRAVRALVRTGSRVPELEVETVTGDLRDAASLQRALAGCDLVFHVAADYRLWAKDSRDLYRSNVDGTRNLLTAARRAGVDRVVYTSTVGCIGIPPGRIGD